MPFTSPAVRVVIRLPSNRPEDALPDPPRIEWNSDKEHILWEVIAKSRAIEGAGTDWKGLAAHLQVPLPYLLYRAQARYEEDLRGLQGLGHGLNVRSPIVAFPAVSSPQQLNAEYFPRLSERPSLPQRDSMRARLVSSSSTTPGTCSTGPGTSTLRPLGVRARLSSLGHARSVQARSSQTQLRSPLAITASHSGLPNSPTYPRTTKKISSSSTITLQGPRKSRTSICPLSPASSHAGSSSGGDAAGEEDEDDDEEDEEAQREEEADRAAEEQEALTRKLRELERLMTKDALGLVASPAPPKGKSRDRGRTRPLSISSASVASVSASASALSSSTRPSSSRSQSHQSLSSMGSPQGSIPSIPSPPAHAHSHSRTHAHARTNHYPHAHSNPQSPQRVSSPMARHFGTAEKSSSPPALSPRSVQGTHVRALRLAAAGLPSGTQVGTGRVSEQGSEASSFSDLSDASLSTSALESALMSNIRGGGSRISSFARSNLMGRRGGVRQ